MNGGPALRARAWGRSRRQASAIYPERRRLRTLAGETDTLAERTGGGVWLPLRHEREDGGGLGEALPSGVCEERSRLLQEMQREYSQGLPSHGHHGAGAAGPGRRLRATRPGRLCGLGAASLPLRLSVTGREGRERPSAAEVLEAHRADPFRDIALTLQEKPGK